MFRALRKRFERLHPMFREQAEDLPHFTFWREGLSCLVRNVCEAHRLAGEPIDLHRVALFIASAPRSSEELSEQRWQHDSYCNAVLRQAFERSPDRRHDVRRLSAYFFSHYTSRPWRVQDMVESSFLGILGTLEEEGLCLSVSSAHPVAEVDTTTEGAE